MPFPPQNCPQCLVHSESPLCSPVVSSGEFIPFPLPCACFPPLHISYIHVYTYIYTPTPPLSFPPRTLIQPPNSLFLRRKIPWRMSSPQKARQRKRLRMVDNVVATLAAALQRSASDTAKTTKSIERWRAEMPLESEMRPKDKYTMFDRKEKSYRKGVHSEF